MSESNTDDKQETPRTEKEVFWTPTRDQRGIVEVVPSLFAKQLESELAEANARCERMLDAEQERLLLASEDEIRKEILADGRDPDEYLKAMDTVMKVTGENALLKHDLQKALANHSADLSARGATEQEPIAWRWRNKGGQWWYREDAPANPPAVPLESDAVIEPLYALPWSQYVK